MLCGSQCGVWCVMVVVCSCVVMVHVVWWCGLCGGVVWKGVWCVWCHGGVVMLCVGVVLCAGGVWLWCGSGCGVLCFVVVLWWCVVWCAVLYVCELTPK